VDSPPQTSRLPRGAATSLRANRAPSKAALPRKCRRATFTRSPREAPWWAAARQACRFDIVAVSPYHWPQHIENAFYGDG